MLLFPVPSAHDGGWITLGSLQVLFYKLPVLCPLVIGFVAHTFNKPKELPSTRKHSAYQSKTHQMTLALTVQVQGTMFNIDAIKLKLNANTKLLLYLTKENYLPCGTWLRSHQAALPLSCPVLLEVSLHRYISPTVWCQNSTCLQPGSSWQRP